MPFSSLGTLTAPHGPENSIYPFYYALYTICILPVDVTGSSLLQCEGNATDLTYLKPPGDERMYLPVLSPAHKVHILIWVKDDLGSNLASATICRTLKIFFLILVILFTYLLFCVLPACLCTIARLLPQRPEKGIRSPGTRAADGSKPLCGCLKWNPGHLQEQPVLLTVELSISPAP